MARPIRIEYSNAYYHITSRGNAREAIFKSGRDYETFLKILGEGSNKYRVDVYAFTLMTNHYHILIKTRQANLSRFMRHLNGIYTQTYNRLYRRVGHVTQGRYTAILVEDESYFTELIRYMHLNPYRAKMVKDIDKYLYSSHQAVIRSKESEQWSGWYDVNRILQHFGSSEKEAIQRYYEFIEDGKQRSSRNVLKEAHFGYILGSESLVKWVQRNFLDKKEDREYRGLKEIKGNNVGVEEILTAVGRELGVSRESMIEARRGKGDVNIGRLMAIYLIHKNCSISQKELGVIFGGVSNVAISMSISRFRKEHEHDNKISHLLLKVAHSLNVKT